MDGEIPSNPTAFVFGQVEQVGFGVEPRAQRAICTTSTMPQYSCVPGPSATLASGPELSAGASVPCPSPIIPDEFACCSLTPLVKEELRFAIQSKRLAHGLAATVDDHEPPHKQRLLDMPRPLLTPAEEERKKRRRQRNKVAAARCRNKKKEHTETLQQESERLEKINGDLKAQIEQLKNERQQLVYMLNLHRPTCIVRAQQGQTPEDERNLFLQQLTDRP
uniref:cyclic AMP-dependent transcription factor ATF-3 isoform X1 n=2 Tax=Myxine glutinosa TaxID=7769 RepID=UPI00358FCC3C